MLNELGPFPLLMHHFTENISEFRNLAIPKEQFQQFKDLVLSTITQAICGYNQDQERKKRAMKLYDEIYNIPIRNDHKFRNMTGGIALQVFSCVATTNYDLVLVVLLLILPTMTTTKKMTEYNLLINTLGKPDLLLIWKIL